MPGQSDRHPVRMCHRDMEISGKDLAMVSERRTATVRRRRSLLCRIGRRAVALATTAAMAFGGGMTAFGAGWQQDGTGWWYEREDGSYPVSTWYEDTDGSWYFFDERGYMIANCYRVIDGNIYSFRQDGRWGGVMFSDIMPGMWTGDRYDNAWSGLHLSVPAGYQVETAADTGTIGSAQTFVEFVVRIPDGTGSGMELEYADAYSFSGGSATTPEYVISLYSLRLALLGYTIEGTSTVNLGGKTYLKLSADGAGVMKRDLYCRKVGDHYFECLTAIYWLASKPYMDVLLAGIH